MTDRRCFFDSNVLVYLLDKDVEKRTKVRELLDQQSVISTQVIAENINVALKKLKIENSIVLRHVMSLKQRFNVAIIEPGDLLKAIDLHNRYKYSFWDSLILASALSSECEIVYSEDMQHDQLIEARLRIVNPFI